MENWVIKECLYQLQKVYVYSEHQFVNAALNTDSNILCIFFELRAYERRCFVEDIQFEIEKLDCGQSKGKTLEQLYLWHKKLYGEYLKEWPITDINILPIDEKSLEICKTMLFHGLPKAMCTLIKEQAIQIESTLLSLRYLQALYN